MKNIFSKVTKKVLFFSTLFVVTIMLSAVAIANFGPDRPTRVWTPQENGFDYVTFNSFTNVPNGIGDERNFLQGVVKGNNTWQDPVKDVKNGQTVKVKIYIHNNSNPKYNDTPGQPGIARDVNVQVKIPTGLTTSKEVKAYISASNAKPKKIFDTLDITSINSSLFQLSYIPGSAKMGGQTLNDSIFTTGLNIGDQKGCFKYVREIVFEMKVEKPAYKVQKSARLKGENSTQWRKIVNAKIGDDIEWRIAFVNDGSTRLNGVEIVDALPPYTKIVPGSIKLINGNNPTGYTYGSKAVQNNGKSVKVDINDYMPGSNAFVYLETVIQDDPAIQCGTFQITNVGYATPFGLGTLNSNAKVNITNDNCSEPKTPVVACDTLNSLKLALNKKLAIGQTAEFTVGYHVVNVGINSITFKVNGKVVQDSKAEKYKFTPTKAGTYDISVTLQTTQGPVTSQACKDTVEVPPVADTPLYSCEQFKLTRIGRKIGVSFLPTGINGAVFKDATIIYSADGNQRNVVTTNDLDSNNKVVNSYVFASADTNVKAVATVRFNVTDAGSTTVKEATCKGTAVLGTSISPSEIPDTGPGSTLVLMFLALVGVAGLSSFAHRRFTLRR